MSQRSKRLFFLCLALSVVGRGENTETNQNLDIPRTHVSGTGDVKQVLEDAGKYPAERHLDKKHLGSAMSGWLQDRNSGERDKKHLGSAMSGWLQDQSSGERDKKHLGSAMSEWLQDQSSGERDKKHLGSAMSGWLQEQTNNGMNLEKKHLGPAMSSWLQRKSYLGYNKRHIGAAMSGWLKHHAALTSKNKRADETATQEKRHIGSAMSRWVTDRGQRGGKRSQDNPGMGDTEVEKRHFGSAASGWSWYKNRQDNNYRKRHYGSAISPWLTQKTNTQIKRLDGDGLSDSSSVDSAEDHHHLSKRSLGAHPAYGASPLYDVYLAPSDLSLYQPSFQEPLSLEKRHLGSAVSSWLMQMVDRRYKRHIGSAMSDWLRTFHGGQLRSFRHL